MKPLDRLPVVTVAQFAPRGHRGKLDLFHVTRRPPVGFPGAEPGRDKP